MDEVEGNKWVEGSYSTTSSVSFATVYRVQERQQEAKVTGSGSHRPAMLPRPENIKTPLPLFHNKFPFIRSQFEIPVPNLRLDHPGFNSDSAVLFLFDA